jgi:adenine-specific DNA-methyltransferase
MDGKSLDITAELLAQLKALIPDVFSEDKIDLQRLKQALGEDIFVHGEHYELNWAGKSEARKEIQKQTTATLVPNRADSVDFDNANHIFIEGENLEVLRTLQKSYFGKVKMIYIDPPYNTGSDSFVYPDDYTERQDEYKKRTGLTNGDGYLNKQDLWRKNVKENGQFHSVWMSMMYPRLYLSRNLLREDGVIFISIDDNEMANLKVMCDEVFGEENFVGQIVWQKRTSPDARLLISAAHDYILIYARTATFIKETINLMPLDDNRLKDYANLDDDERGDWASRDITGQSGHATSSQFYEIETPSGTKYFPPEGRCWSISEKSFKELVNENRIWFGKTQNSRPRLKLFLSDNKGKSTWTWWTNKDVGHGQEATKEFNDIMNASDLFNNPKPIRLIKRLLQIANHSHENNIVLDFFAGSGTTAQAVLEMNEEDGGNRRFICVQMPEKIEAGSEAAKAGYKTIADITQARIKKVIEKIQKERALKAEKKKGELFNSETDSPLSPLGFQSYKLASSNFKQWNKYVSGEEAILAQLDIFQQSEKENSLPENMLYELLIKGGFDLSMPIERLTINETTTIYTIDDGKLCILFDKYNIEIKKAVVAAKPKRLIVLDSCFDGDDVAITNLQLDLRENEIALTII